MINFHEFLFQNRNSKPVNAPIFRLKRKYKLIYFDEFQVTNIVDAMILGNLFKKIFDENFFLFFHRMLK